MTLFYAPEIVAPIHYFDSEESVHISRVLRLREGALIDLTDGKGNLFHGRLIQSSARASRAEVLSQSFHENPVANLHIAIAPTKNISRFEWFLEKVTEIGIREITPIYCDHSERVQLKNTRLNKLLIAAVKQSGQLWLPVLHEAEPFQQFVKKSHPADKFIAYCATGQETFLANLYKPGHPTVILIGPEGDFSPEEADQAVRSGFRTVSLGPTRLRTETAGIVACSFVSAMKGLHEYGPPL